MVKQQVLESLVAEYVANNPRSREMFERAKKSLPGGNTRTGAYMDPFPIYISRGEGVHLIDLDGHRLLDFVNNNTALILGHANPIIVDALQAQLTKGTAFSRPTALEVEMAELLRGRVPSLERIRFCSSGTEAVLNATRAAKAFTGKRKIARFEGAYHGVSEYALISHAPPLGPDLGPAHRPRSVPSSAGLSPAIAEEVLVLPFNDATACEEIISSNAEDLAAVIVDPLATGAGMTLPVDGFLTRLREITMHQEVLLIFDEIISFRASRGGAQELYDVRPDLTCLAKVIAGGTPGAAFGGRADVMALYDPTSGAPKIPQSGTYNANPLSMVAGMAALRALTPAVYDKLSALTQRLGTALDAVFKEAGVQAQVTVVGSLFHIHFLLCAPRNYREAALDDHRLHRLLFFSLLNAGIHWSYGGNVSVPMETAHIDQLVSEVQTALRRL
ncbi:MAG: aspartate aminotransferase family protein [Candidatus Poribacteria bacterium]|nr:aspartate aminotransferase family protein [Candidatus Poribacteria bacterium]